MSHWLPLYLALLAAAILSPLSGSCLPQHLRLSPVPTDFALNVIGFLPFGWALARRPMALAALLAVALSAALEWGQQWVFRTPSPWDVLANTIGAILGVYAARRFDQPLRHAAAKLGRLQVGLLILLLSAGVTGAAARAALGYDWRHGFSSWTPEPLVLGPEEPKEPPWQGVLRELAIFDRVLDETTTPPIGETWAGGGPIFHMLLGEGGRTHARLDGPEGPREMPLEVPAGMEIERVGLAGSREPWILPETIARHVFERTKSADQITISARMRAVPRGPIQRIVSLSRGYMNRDFSLQQIGDRVAFLFRTPVLGTNGMFEKTSGPVTAGPLPEREITLLASADRYRARISWDGRCEAESYLPLIGTPARIGSHLTLTIALATALSALGAALVLHRASRLARIAAAIVFGAGAWTVLYLSGSWAHFPPTLWREVLPGVLSIAAVLPIVGTPTR